MKIIINILLVVGLLVLQPVAHASIVKFTFEGVVTQVSTHPELSNLTEVGGVFSGHVIFNTDAQDRDSNPEIGFYGAEEIMVSLNGFTGFSDSVDLTIGNQATVDQYVVWAGRLGGVIGSSQLGDLILTNIGLGFYENTGQLFENDLLTGYVPDLNDFGQTAFSMGFSSSQSIDAGYIYGTVTSVNAAVVHEPGLVAFFVLSCAFLVRRQRVSP
ncbi:hypothetical protein [Lacimicrobium alkaliphilum]|uniref:PEP-CTERM protein-sorting domain-containing protein n=1 Tax=Lacimicrobium alkaliphilum TaxID=1526571 RepID=A0ABQ1QX29_9ALTE|nr:hypothetical protein [Lacimicrobium alkaliphilum]GGD50478.1 hypothetical protein GCM10011357_02990 [Lacimicrobium alkaliphilum]